MTTPQLTAGPLHHVALLTAGLTNREDMLLSKVFRLAAELSYTKEGRTLVDKGFVVATLLSEKAIERVEHG